MKNIFRWAVPAVQAVVSAVLLYLLLTCGMIPVKYLGIASAVLVLLLLITIWFSGSDNLSVRIMAAVLTAAVCAVLLIAAVNIRQIMKTLDGITASDKEKVIMIAAVPERSAARTIEDTSGFTFALYAGADEDAAKEIVKEIELLNGDTGLHIQSYDSVLEMAQALLDGEADGAIYNQAYTALLDDVLHDYSSQIRVIHEKDSDAELSANGGEDADGAFGADVSLTKDTYTVYISGIDVSGPINTTSRSDVNILMTVNPNTHRILLTTTPRDFYVYIPGISGGERDKLTHAGVYGIRSSIRAMESLYGIDITNYIRINFDSLIQLVDTLGGVDVNSEYEFDSGNYHFVKGINHLDGDQALSFSRNRHSFEDGDNQRGRNQLLVLEAIIDKLQSPALLKNSSGVLDVVGRSMQTSIQTSQITEAISWQLDNPQRWEISRQAVTGLGDSRETFSMPGKELYVMWPDEESVRDAAQKIEEVLK